jgi:Hemerythrin HHE cation binding domain
MSKLIEKLKQDHQDLVSYLTEARKVGINSEGLKKLKSAQVALLAHLQHEDIDMYPVLRRAAAKDPHLKKILDTFAKEMEGITQFAFDFFAKYEDGGSGVEFARDFGKLIADLNNRMNREENILYKEFDRIVSKKAA